MNKLSKEEYIFCSKLRNEISHMLAISEENRQDIIKYITKKCIKHQCSFNRIQSEEQFIIWQFMLNGKENFLVFDRFGKLPPNIVPAGLITR